MSVFRKKNVWIVTGFIVIFAIIFFSHFENRLNADEGIVLEGAWNLYNHRQLYVDFFEFVTPGSFYVILFIWKILGVSFWAANFFSIILAFGISVAIYLSAQIIKPSRFNILGAFLFALASSGLFLINHNIYNLFFIVWAIYFSLLAINQKRLSSYFFSGLMSGLAIIFLQQKGVVLSVIIFLFFLITNYKEWKKLVIYVSGIILPLLVLLAWPLEILFKDLIDFPFFHYLEPGNINYLWLIIAIFILGLSFLFFRKEKRKSVYLILFISGGLLLSTTPLPDNYHVIIALTPLLVLFGLILEKVQSNKSIILKLSNYSLIFIATLFYLSPILYYPILLKTDYSWVNMIKQKCPGQYIYAGPFAPNIYFETRKLSVTPFPFLVENHNTPEQFNEARIYLSEMKPSCAILVYQTSNENSLVRFKHSGDNPVENYIRDNYHIIDSYSIIRVYGIN